MDVKLWDGNQRIIGQTLVRQGILGNISNFNQLRHFDQNLFAIVFELCHITAHLSSIVHMLILLSCHVNKCQVTGINGQGGLHVKSITKVI